MQFTFAQFLLLSICALVALNPNAISAEKDCMREAPVLSAECEQCCADHNKEATAIISPGGQLVCHCVKSICDFFRLTSDDQCMSCCANQGLPFYEFKSEHCLCLARTGTKQTTFAQGASMFGFTQGDSIPSGLETVFPGGNFENFGFGSNPNMAHQQQPKKDIVITEIFDDDDDSSAPTQSGGGLMSSLYSKITSYI